MEVELKLAIPPRALARLRRHPLLRGKGSTRMVHSVYYDTPELDLWRQGMAFRVRRDGEKWRQALKGGGSAQAGLHQRMELEVELAGPQPDFAAITVMPEASAFAPYASASQLAPMFTASFKRTSKNIQYKKLVRIDAAIDRGFIASASGAAPICELELELVSGPPAALFDFALALLENVPLEIENRSKAQRGYALYRNEALQPVKACAPVLASDVSATDAFKSIAGALLAQAQANRQGVIEEGDPEYLHQMRVAVRRLRAIFGAYAKLLPKTALRPRIAELKWLARALGPARDADVFISEIWPPLHAALSATLNANLLLTWLDAQWAAHRHAAAAAARRALAARRYQRMMLDFGRWLQEEAWRAGASPAILAALDEPARNFARCVLERRDAKVRGTGHAITRLDDKQLHVLRVEIKKLRYAADSFGALFDSSAVVGMLDNCSRLQDILGALNDIHVAEQQVAAELEHRRGRAATRLGAALAAWRSERAAKLRRKLGGAWRAYRRAEKFW